MTKALVLCFCPSEITDCLLTPAYSWYSQLPGFSILIPSQLVLPDIFFSFYILLSLLRHQNLTSISIYPNSDWKLIHSADKNYGSELGKVFSSGGLRLWTLGSPWSLSPRWTAWAPGGGACIHLRRATVVLFVWEEEPNVNKVWNVGSQGRFFFFWNLFWSWLPIKDNTVLFCLRYFVGLAHFTSVCSLLSLATFSVSWSRILLGMFRQGVLEDSLLVEGQ